MLRSLTFALIAVNLLVFVADWAFPQIGAEFAFTPSRALAEPWTFVTSQFLHADLLHISFNMFTLFMFGAVLESRVRPHSFIIFYLAAGVAGNLLQMGMAYSGLFPSHVPGIDPADIPGVGASGAIMGVIGALGILTPRLQMMVPLIPMPVPMYVGVIIFALFNFAISFAATNIGTGAHLGGLALGLLYGVWMKRQYEGRRTRVSYVWE